MVYVRGAKDRMGSSLEGRPEKRNWAKLWIKKLNFVATLPRLDSINLEGKNIKIMKKNILVKSQTNLISRIKCTW